MNVIKETKFLIVGSGGIAIGFAANLKMAGVEDFLIITKHDAFGGAWYQNKYPGCQTDVTANIYQLSFSLKTDWTGNFASQEELCEYLQDIAADYKLEEKTDFNTEMLEADWLEDKNRWRVVTPHGIYLAEFLIPCTGFLEEMVMPKLPGMELFKGKAFHSALWPEGYTGAGDRVAVLGTGASSIQIVPAIQPIAEKVYVFQRTANYLRPKNYVAFNEEQRKANATNGWISLEAFRQASAEIDSKWIAIATGSQPDVLEQFQQEALAYLEQEVKDPELRAKLTPPFQWGCKRIQVSDDFYKVVQKPNVELIAEAVVGLNEKGAISASGREVELDTIVFATGFIFGGTILSKIKRRDGITVGQYQRDWPRAYKSTSVACCPNLFLIGGSGPNGQTPSGFIPGESMPGYVLRVVKYMEDNGIAALEVKEEAELLWKKWADDTLRSGPTVSGGCTNYSQDPGGRNKAAWPGSMAGMWEQVRHFEPSDYLDVTAVPAE